MPSCMARKSPLESLFEVFVWNHVINDQIKSYETKNMYLPLQYRDSMRGAVSWVRHHAEQHTK